MIIQGKISSFNKFFESKNSSFDLDVVNKYVSDLKKYVKSKNYTDVELENDIFCQNNQCVLKLHLTINSELYLYIIDFPRLKIYKQVIKLEGAGQPQDQRKKENRELKAKDLPLMIGAVKCLSWVVADIKSLIDLQKSN